MEVWIIQVKDKIMISLKLKLMLMLIVFFKLTYI